MGFCILLMTDGLSLRLLSLELTSYVPNVRNKLLKQGYFWPFAQRELVRAIFWLISPFQLNLADNYYFQENLEMFTYK